MANKTNLSIAAIVGLLVAGYFGFNQEQSKPTSPTEYSSHQAVEEQSSERKTLTSQSSSQHASSQGVERIAEAFQRRQSDVQVQASGRVKAILPDDNEGSRHQKFILELDNGQTVLVAHNIDLAPRIDRLQKGDEVEFNGEYEYSDKGGVIHWTHKDPQNRHAHGWLKHQGKIYQ